MVEGDKGPIHIDISGGSLGIVVDSKTGEVTMCYPDSSSVGGVMFDLGLSRRVERGDNDNTFLGGSVRQIDRIAKVRTTRSQFRLSKGIIHAKARLRGKNPMRWKVDSNRFGPYGGETLNLVLAEVLSTMSNGVALERLQIKLIQILRW